MLCGRVKIQVSIYLSIWLKRVMNHHMKICHTHPLGFSSKDHNMNKTMAFQTWHLIHACKSNPKSIIHLYNGVIFIGVKMKYKCNEKFSDFRLYLNVDSIADLNPGEAKGNSWLDSWMSYFWVRIFTASGSVFTLGQEDHSKWNLCTRKVFDDVNQVFLILKIIHFDQWIRHMLMSIHSPMFRKAWKI